jgi:SAM-dependent methyltransferase
MPACIVCQAEAWAPKWEVLVRCTRCGFVRSAELLSPESAAALYGPGYFAGQEYGNYLADRDVHRRNFAARWRLIRKLAGPLRSVYEIGCAHGLWLEFLSEQGVRAAGIDVAADAVAYAVNTLGQDATVGDFLSAPPARGQFDAFCLWDTIEHLPHPEHYVERIVELLPPGGWLFLTTGDIGSTVATLRGRQWRMIHPPTHLQYFSRATMRRFLSRCGLDVVAIRAVSVYRTLHSVLASLAALGRGTPRQMAAWLGGTLPLGFQKRLGAWIDLGDIMFVAARKPAVPPANRP